MNRSFKQWYLHPVLIFLSTRGLTYLVAYLARVPFLPVLPQGIWQHAVIVKSNTLPLDLWNRWDAHFYQDIAKIGYVEFDPYVAFFPLYPMLMALLYPLTGNMALAGILLSHLAFLGALILLYRLTRFESGENASAQRTLWYIALFPGSLFFSAIYTESTFLFFAVATVYLGRRQQWLAAGCVGALATSTRFIGVLCYLFLMVEWFRCHREVLQRTWLMQGRLGLVWSTASHASGDCETAGCEMIRYGLRSLLWIQLALLGLVAYMGFLYWRFGDYWAFATVQLEWGRGMLVNPARTLAGGAWALWQQSIWVGDAALWDVNFDVAAATLALALVLPIWRRLGASYGLYTLLSVLIPTATGYTMSLTRFMAVVFPVFMMLGVWGAHPWVDRLITVGFAMLLVLFIAVFVNWGFVG